MFHHHAWAVGSYSSGPPAWELSKSKSTQPRSAGRCPTLYTAESATSIYRSRTSYPRAESTRCFHFLHGTIEMRKCGVRSVALGTSSFPPPSSYFAPATIRPCGFLPLLSPRPRPRPLTALSPVSLLWMVLTQPETAGRRPTYPPAMPFPVLQCCQACRMRACGPAPLLLVGQIFMTRIE